MKKKYLNTFVEYAVEWDTDGKNQKKLGLPNTVLVPIELHNAEKIEEGAVANAISDQFGCCVLGLKPMRIVKQ